MNDILKNIFFIVPILLYYFVESMISAIFVTLVWRVFLADTTGIYIKYFQWVAIIWIIKVLFFDVFKMFGAVIAPPPQKEDETNQN